MKDYFDLRALAREGALDASLLGEAIAATFGRRNTEVPGHVPLGLSEEFCARRSETGAVARFQGSESTGRAGTRSGWSRKIYDFVEKPLAIARAIERR